jgi:uncharacterized damage-inducible protein DinB
MDLVQMDLVQHFRRQFAYDHWANREIVDALRPQGMSSARAVQLLAHILSAEQLWLERLTQKPQSLPVWPEADLGRCQSQLVQLEGTWSDYLRGLSLAALSETISYKNSQGEPWTSTVQDVLTHVLMHSAYHRGQIAAEMRGRGHTPAYTDFIHAVRQGFIE